MKSVAHGHGIKNTLDVALQNAVGLAVQRLLEAEILHKTLPLLKPAQKVVSVNLEGFSKDFFGEQESIN